MRLDWEREGDESVEQLRALLRFDTTNPPGNEGPCAEYALSRLDHPRIELRRLDSAGRPNVVARVRGAGSEPPLLLTGHLDVVGVERERWTADPFGAEVRGEWLYGRGALDMKGMVSMFLTVFRLLALEGAPLRRDLVLALVADEEAGCRHGSAFLVAEHPDLVRAGCLIGEFGGFSMPAGAARIYPIQVAEKGIARLGLTARGAPGHGSVPHGDMAVVHLAEAVRRLARARFPVHPVATVRRFLEGLAATQPFPASWVLRRLFSPRFSHWVRRLVPASRRFSLRAMLENTVSPTLLAAGEKANVIPARARVTCDGRILPGQTAADLAREVEAVLAGLPVEVSVEEERPGRENPEDGPLLDLMRRALEEADPGCRPLPYMIPGYTDSSQFGRLGAACYGFCPLKMPADEPFWDRVHGHDERIHLPGYRWGLAVLHRVVREWCAAESGAGS